MIFPELFYFSQCDLEVFSFLLFWFSHFLKCRKVRAVMAVTAVQRKKFIVGIFQRHRRMALLKKKETKPNQKTQKNMLGNKKSHLKASDLPRRLYRQHLTTVAVSVCEEAWLLVAGDEEWTMGQIGSTCLAWIFWETGKMCLAQTERMKRDLFLGQNSDKNKKLYQHYGGHAPVQNPTEGGEQM